MSTEKSLPKEMTTDEPEKGSSSQNIPEETINIFENILRISSEKEIPSYRNSSARRLLLEQCETERENKKANEICNALEGKISFPSFDEDPTSMIFNSLVEETACFLRNEIFLFDIRNAINELHTVEGWSMILDPKETPEEWENKIDKILEEIEMREEFSQHIVEMEKVREILRYYCKLLKTFPAVLRCGQYNLSYFLELLKYGRIERFNDLSNFEKEDGEHHMVHKTIEKVMITVCKINMLMMSSSGIQGLVSGVTKPLEWDSVQDKEGLSKQAFIEYNEYLVENDFFSSNNNPGRCCIS